MLVTHLQRTVMAARSKVVFIALFALVALLPGSRIGAAVPVAILGLNFTGSTLGKESFSVPPDCDGAIGPSHFVEFINGRYSVYNKTNGVRVQTMTDTSFWSVAGVTLRPGWAISDPRLIYDPAVHRWFAAQIDFDPTGTVNTNHFLLGISASGDPTGAWKAVTIPSDPGGTDFADFP